MIKEIMKALGYMPIQEHNKKIDCREQMWVDEYTVMENGFIELNKKNQEMYEQYDKLSTEHEVLYTRYQPYEKYGSLEEYKNQVYFKNSIIQYGGGRGQPKPLHKFLEMDEETEERYVKLVKALTKNMKFTCPDDVIFKLNSKLNKTYNFKKIYEKDNGEYWLTPNESFTAIVIGIVKNGLDCEDVSIFKYCCFKTALKLQNWWGCYVKPDPQSNVVTHEHIKNATNIIDNQDNPNNANACWRLRLCRCNTIGEGNHVMLAWCRGDTVNGTSNGKNVGWFPVESTYYTDKFEEWWNNGVRMDYSNPLYTLQYSWTDEEEYKRLVN